MGETFSWQSGFGGIDVNSFKIYRMSEANQWDDLQTMLHEKDALVVQNPVWYQQLLQQVNDLINHDFNGLLQFLYQMDVSETKLRQMLQQFPAADAAGIIANLLLERQVQKIKSRREYAQRDKDIPEDEKW